MENVLIVTVGTRDIQVLNQKELNFRPPNFNLYENKNIPGYKFFSNPLEDGNKIFHDKYLVDLVEYPIIKPAIDYLVNKGKYISNLILICTDQQFVDEKFRKNDTIHFAKIIEQLVQKHFSKDQIKSIHCLSVSKDVTNFGKMYDFFNERLPQILKNNDDCNLYIYPQGGIDAINFQVLLKCIELFPNTFHLCKSEANIDIEESDFPYKFRKGIEGQKISALIENFYYNEVYSSDHYIKLLAAYAQERLLFNFPGAIEILKNSDLNTPLIELLKSRTQDLYNQSVTNEMSYLKDLYLSIKIVFRKQDYSGFILKIYALCESFLKDEVCRYLKVKNSNNKKTEDDILDSINLNNNLNKNLQVKGIQIPYKLNAAFYLAVCDFFDPNPRSNHLFIKKSLALKNFRNNIAHFAKNIALKEIQNAFLRIEARDLKTDPINSYFGQGNDFWGVSGFGDYEIINDAIRTKLLTNKST